MAQRFWKMPATVSAAPRNPTVILRCSRISSRASGRKRCVKYIAERVSHTPAKHPRLSANAQPVSRPSSLIQRLPRSMPRRSAAGGQRALHRLEIEIFQHHSRSKGAGIISPLSPSTEICVAVLPSLPASFQAATARRIDWDRYCVPARAQRGHLQSVGSRAVRSREVCS
jgi:hypothetical protein